MRNILFILFISVSLSISAQRVISSAANETQGISWTIGEIITETIVNDNVLLVQGFNQQYGDGTNSIDETKRAFVFRVYPNPVINQLCIDCEENESYSWQLTNMLGQQINSGKSTNTKTTVDMTSCSTGNYILTVTSRQETKSIIIIKK